jgi:hypothetical protein
MSFSLFSDSEALEYYSTVYLIFVQYTVKTADPSPVAGRIRLIQVLEVYVFGLPVLGTVKVSR